MSSPKTPRAENSVTAEKKTESKEPAYIAKNTQTIAAWLKVWMESSKGRSGGKLSESQQLQHTRYMERLSRDYFKEDFKVVTKSKVEKVLQEIHSDRKLGVAPKKGLSACCTRMFQYLKVSPTEEESDKK